ncbi:RNA polymerase sigma-70 factor, ECF subfamily [Ruminococcus sp. YE71]|uniref:RNA polymerase sigma factor n=1 Tax=unclassified Ruminococcus TaxID=2608920 RepID=UPI00088754D9|nr:MULTISPECIES: sigma-70 family RNA polymerase sigma factor [unclassified Ruminococcus]SDA21852.1 RNA polymerase sigma-70 factor, ECF subfamily [Ruminococcus sp. YE78]SFW36980.1 RNA polymerase sigma-70 factor, ECF subfamily [Ruminococcus sp. YE71]
MEDLQIIELYWQRKESAIHESRNKYGGYCSAIANNILHSAEDSEECVNDTWFRAWNAMPPEKPSRLAVFLGRITRNLAIDRYRRDRSQKFGGGQTALCLDELGECIGEESPIEDRIALKELIDVFLHSLPEKNRKLFLLRYWYMMPVAEIAKRNNMSEGAVKMILQRVRNKLKDYLEQEGVGV